MRPRMHVNTEDAFTPSEVEGLPFDSPRRRRGSLRVNVPYALMDMFMYMRGHI